MKAGGSGCSGAKATDKDAAMKAGGSGCSGAKATDKDAAMKMEAPTEGKSAAKPVEMMTKEEKAAYEKKKAEEAAKGMK